MIDDDHRRIRRVGASAEQRVDSLPAVRILGGEVNAQSGDVDPPSHGARTILIPEVDVTEAIPPAAKAAVMRKGAAGRPITIDVTGSSMGKAIPSGSRVLVAAGDRPRRGEVWAFVVDEGLVVVHRFRRERDDSLWFQGDGNTGVDRPVRPEMLVGRVVAVDVEGRRRTRLGTLARIRGRLWLDTTALFVRIRSTLVLHLKEGI
jgi:hypothetical protein